VRAGSFLIETRAASKVAQALSDHTDQLLGARRRASLDGKGGAVVFVCGQLSRQLPEVAAAVAELQLPFTVLIAAGASVLSQDGEFEDRSAASGMIWTGGRCEGLSVHSRTPDDLGEMLSRLICDRSAKTSPTVLLFPHSEGFSAEALTPLYQSRGTPHVFGGGTVGPHGSYVVSPNTEPETGSACMLFLRGIAPPHLRSSPACRLLTPLRPITEARGAMVLEIDGEPALDVLSGAGEHLEGGHLMLVALAPEGTSDRHQIGGRADLVLRGVQGVDPARRGIQVSDEIRPGMRVGLAVRDAHAARTDLEAVARELVRDIRGAAPSFGVYINCAGRGSRLYEQFDVDTRILRQRFPGMPIAGMASAFEIGPHGGRPALQLYSGVLGLFTAPS